LKTDKSIFFGKKGEKTPHLVVELSVILPNKKDISFLQRNLIKPQKNIVHLNVL